MRHTSRRVGAWLAALTFSAGLLALSAPAIATQAPATPKVAQCEEATVSVSAEARGYLYNPDSHTKLRFVDGLVTNDSSVTAKVDKVRVSWAEKPGVTSDFWVGCQLLAPGQWTTFHDCWPNGIDPTWTVGTVTPYAYARTGASGPLGLRLDGVTGPVDDDGMRVWTATVTNTSAATVSSVELIGREMDGAAFVDSLFSWDIPDAIGPGQTVSIEVRGKSPWPVAPSADMRFTALERPTITLTADTLTPVYGSPVTFRVDLKRSDGSPATGSRTLKIYHSFDGQKWECDYFRQDTTTGSVVTAITPDRPTYYRAVYWGGDDLGQVIGEWSFVTPQVAVSAPSTPKRVKAKRSFAVSGRIGAGAANKSKTVTISAEKKVGRRWVRKVKVYASADQSGSYKKSLKLKSRGTYRIRAYRSGAGYSKYKTVKAR